jgi:hypothetical protein
VRYYPLALSASIAFAVVAIVFDVRARHNADQLQVEVDRLRIQRDSLVVQNTDLQKRVDAQLELDRRQHLELLRHADKTQSELISPQWPREEFDTIEVETLRWEDAGRPAGMYWGEFDRFYALEQLRRQSR